MKNKVSYFILALFVSIQMIFLTSCSQKPSPSEVALSYYNLIIKQDSQSIEALGMPSETASSIISDIKANLRNQIASSLSLDSNQIVSKDQLSNIETAYFKTLNKLNATASFVQSGNSSEVTLSTTCLDFNKLNQKATDLALAEVDILNYTDKDLYLTDLTTAYMSYLIEAYENAAPEEKTNEATFTFTKQNGLWLPEDYESFTTKLCELITSTND